VKGNRQEFMQIGEEGYRTLFASMPVGVFAVRPDGAITYANPARTGDFVVISVADTGPGIDPAMMEHLFEPFATTRQLGRGMGLAAVFGSVKQAGGWVDVSSDHGAGTEVSLYLPRYVEQR